MACDWCNNKDVSTSIAGGFHLGGSDVLWRAWMPCSNPKDQELLYPLQLAPTTWGRQKLTRVPYSCSGFRVFDRSAGTRILGEEGGLLEQEE